MTTVTTTFVVFHLEDTCEQRALPLACFEPTCALTLIQQVMNEEIHMKSSALCASYLHDEQCPFGAVCNELHLPNAAAAACGFSRPPAVCEPYSPSSACSSNFSPGPSENFSDCEEVPHEEDWDFVRRRLSLSSSDHDELRSLHKADTDYSDFDSEDDSELAAHGWAAAPNNGDDTGAEMHFSFSFPAQNNASALQDTQSSDRDTDYSDFDSENEALWATAPHCYAVSTNTDCTFAFHAQNSVTEPEMHFTFPSQCAADLTACHENETDCDSDYSDFDSDDEEQWATNGWACQPNCTAVTVGDVSVPPLLNAPCALQTDTDSQPEMVFTFPPVHTDSENYDEVNSDYSDFDSEADESELQAKGWLIQPVQDSKPDRIVQLPQLLEWCPEDQGAITPQSVREWANLGVMEFRLDVNLVALKLQWYQHLHG
eukprot:TRINITY_DN64603_c1_g1_i1.p1 TRINITY_DN64603_c1_g1~~TRINITY_DN64603_c1_g1_i1.p1  ORF type:complete len:429 (-),score=50.88 TRINITY_DN64603_c1_g1_i1:10-1296(-)